ncbi:MAG: membrane protein insertase YidC [Leptospiraceae bacterium]|nr:membrane protein insertase YidC [Leptospiraceae bacterium]
MEDRNARMMMAIIAAFAIWIGLKPLFFPEKPKDKKTTQEKVTPPAKKDTDVSKPGEEKVPEKKSIIKEPEKPTKAAKIDIKTPSEVKTFHIITGSHLVKLSSMGGRIEAFYVKNHKDTDGTDVLVAKTEEDEIEFNGEKYRAIEITRNNGFDFNFAYSPEEAVFSPYNNLNFSAEYDSEKKIATFSSPSLDGKVTLQKQYIFYENENYFRFKYTIINDNDEEITLSADSTPLFLRTIGSLGPIKKGELNDREVQHYFRYYYLDGSFKDSIDGISNEGGFGSFLCGRSQPKIFESIYPTAEGLDFWGAGSRYFIAVLDPLNHNPGGVVLDHRKGNTTGILAIYKDWKIPARSSKELDYAAYVGIREASGMSFRDAKLDPYETKETPFANLSENLNKSFNQGLTTPFRNGIVWILKKLHDYAIPNYGWCIIVFGILFKLVFYPLNQKQAESMKKLQALNPKIQEINQKFANDPQVKQQKILALYKENNVSPMSGCFPMVIQIPIFIALYTAFSDTIELWKSPFLWISDLSEPDTVWTSPAILGSAGIALNVLPLIMVASQIVQTKMTSVSTDPNQKTMMYIMPVIMLYFFWSMPSGVTLYWTIQNILSIGQQWYTNKFVESRKAKVTTTVTKKG